ncbi:MAG: phosphatidylserine decarboxylase [Bacteroidales bacterium]|nr:phosphatidylserine decarboxylase [Bacteroidales bacterium]
MRLDKNTYGTVLAVYLFSAVVVFVLWRWVPQWWINLPLTLGMVWFCAWQTYFHMVPDRKPSGNEHHVSAVSDGKVVFIGKVFAGGYLQRDCLMISVYMDFWDLHANFWPVTGTVSYAEYFPGKHLLAFKPKASEENEHFCTAIRTPEGKEVLFKQLAGGFARRIVCYAKKGMPVKAGDQCGIIKFGSRIDYYLPLDAKILVKEGDLVKGVTSIIAEI